VGRTRWAAAYVAVCCAFAPLTAPVPAIATTPATAKRQPGCQTFFTATQIDNAIGPGANVVSLQKARASAIYGSLIKHGQNCGFLWDTSASPPAGNPAGSCDPDSLGRYSDYSPGFGWIVSYGYSNQEWKKLQHEEKTEPVAPDPNSNPNQPVAKVKLSHKSRAFTVTDPTYCQPTGELPATALYVLTRHHDLLVIFMWPMTAGAEMGLAESVLNGRPSF
jgi:hypothetical protein